jgi:hypothetical protein|tara:strand:- start:549 stop:749 length:201 start_codon:yes stop_codon:yes gene_type:complete
MKYEKNNKCCNSNNLTYEDDLYGGEMELWQCRKCKKCYHIPIDIIRDFDNKEYVDYKEIQKVDCNI